MRQLCALPQALDPLSPPPPNITRLGDMWDHRTRFNVRRGGRRKAEMAKNPCLIRGLIPACSGLHLGKNMRFIAENLVAGSTSCWLHARGAARRGGQGAQRGSRRGRWAPWRAASTMAWLWAMCEIENSTLLPTCAGVTPCWAAAVAAWALTSISGSLGCH